MRNSTTHLLLDLAITSDPDSARGHCPVSLQQFLPHFVQQPTNKNICLLTVQSPKTEE